MLQVEIVLLILELYNYTLMVTEIDCVFSQKSICNFLQGKNNCDFNSLRKDKTILEL
jgi:hypothetical protein